MEGDNGSPKGLTEPSALREEFGGEFGFVIYWTSISHYVVDGYVEEIVARDSEKDGGGIFETERYLRFMLKWDACDHFWFGDNTDSPKGIDGYLHLCGPRYIQGLCDLLKHLYHRSFELMGREVYEGWPEASGAKPAEGTEAEQSPEPEGGRT